MPVRLEQRLITVAEYHKMIKTGILQPHDKVELLNGQLIKMSPIGSEHAACVEKISELLKRLLPSNIMVRSQNPIILGDLSEPEPDLSIVKRKDNFYADSHPTSDDTFWVFEVADSTLDKDKEVKSTLYAKSNIPFYAIVNLEEKEVILYQQPRKGWYTKNNIISLEGTIELSPFDLVVEVKSLFP